MYLALCARGEKRVKEAAQALQDKYGIRAIGARADVSNVEDINNFIQEIEKEFEVADILVDDAGTGSADKIGSLSNSVGEKVEINITPPTMKM